MRTSPLRTKAIYPSLPVRHRSFPSDGRHYPPILHRATPATPGLVWTIGLQSSEDKKEDTASLKAIGLSMLGACPECGITRLTAPGILVAMYSEGLRNG